MIIRFPRIQIVWVGLLIVLLNISCGSRAPYLNPVAADGTIPSDSEGVTIEVKPVETSGFRNTERDRLGIDLSAYYSAFEVWIRNGTSRSVTVEGDAAELRDDLGTSYEVLSALESMDYYQSNHSGDQETVLLPKSLKVARQEMERIRLLRLKTGEIPAGESGHGVLLFRKLPAEQCQQVSLFFRGLRIAGEDSNREFKFSFSCG